MPSRRAQFSGKLSEVRSGAPAAQGQQQQAQPAPGRALPPHQTAAAANQLGKTVFDLPTPKPGSPVEGEAEGEEEEEVCFICAEPFKYFSVGSCNHVRPPVASPARSDLSPY